MVESGFLCNVCGASGGGKTQLMFKLLEDFPSFKPINFEKHFNDDITLGYLNFYKDIDNSLKTRNVLAESIYSYQNNKWVYYNPKNAIIILCEPPYKEHERRVNEYKSKYGNKAFLSRFGNTPLEKLRSNARSALKKHILYTGNEYGEIKYEVGKYVASIR